MVDQCARTTSNSSVDRLSAKGSRAGGSMGSASVTSGWWGVVASLIDLFGDGGFVTSSSVHAFRAWMVRLWSLVNFFPHFRTCAHCGLFSITSTATAAAATAKTTYGPHMLLQIVPSLKRCIAFTRIFRSLCLVARWHLYWLRRRIRVFVHCRMTREVAF